MWEIMIYNVNTNERNVIYTTRPAQYEPPAGWEIEYCEYVD